MASRHLATVLNSVVTSGGVRSRGVCSRYPSTKSRSVRPGHSPLFDKLEEICLLSYYQVINLGVLSGTTQSRAMSINNAGTSVGTSGSADNSLTRAVIWRNGAIRDLGDPPVAGEPTTVSAIAI